LNKNIKVKTFIMRCLSYNIFLHSLITMNNYGLSNTYSFLFIQNVYFICSHESSSYVTSSSICDCSCNYNMDNTLPCFDRRRPSHAPQGDASIGTTWHIWSTCTYPRSDSYVWFWTCVRCSYYVWLYQAADNPPIER